MTVSVKEVARRAGVSVGTVSNAMNHPHKVSPATRHRINAVIEELGYIRNDAARQLRVGQSTTLGLVVLDVRNPFFTDLARGVEQSAARHGFTVTLGNSDESPQREADYLDLFEQQRVAGVIISPYADITPRLRRLIRRGTPCVVVEQEAQDPVGSVSVDDIEGGRLAVEHLIAVGRRRIAFVGGSPRIRQVADRLRGAKLAAEQYPGVSLETIEIRSGTVLEGRQIGRSIVARAERPDAVFAANDLIALGLMQAFTMEGAGVRVPADIALIGYDDIDFAVSAVVSLSTIRQPAQLIGCTAVEMLAGNAQVRHVVFQPELVVRDSTARG